MYNSLISFVFALCAVGISGVAVQVQQSHELEVIEVFTPPGCGRDGGVAKGDHATVEVSMSTLNQDILYRSSIEKVKLGTPDVIMALNEGLKGMCVGSRRKLIAPPALAYGVPGANTLLPLVGIST